ncbi:hypothetical protein VL4N_13880 [Vagococcus lutrae]|uniref:hypothetical protein n=1 Tax=Vagococcus lutrae TaxID=81947 RepID=UPI00192657AE|nr:hypothetical protein [Vagococcus lutrae]GEQ62006.1 hypothetical protein VL2N_13420 [Vagococcus lutrae]GEQ63947.1 hypothetical protein VL3N_13890 [Vagococcus lutrae]GEQ65838.1 hypothetical protein VL4N_13880 [Vagococcus lutrae]
MKYLLLDIDDTIAPLNYKSIDAVYVDCSEEGELGIPNYIADWLKTAKEKEIKIIWCTSRRGPIQYLVETKLGFKSDGTLQFFNQKSYHWNKLYSIIDFCNKHSEDIVILADNDIKEGTREVKNLPENLKLVWPSDTRRGCLSVEDLELIDSF